MRVLVFGAGVLGSYLAHVLVRGDNDVTVLARGKRAEQLQQNGLVIRHYFQHKSTVDSVKIISELKPNDCYDLIFVVMKYNDFPAVLPILAQNQSQNIILVGNNGTAHKMQQELQDMSDVNKNILFGFQLSAGIRKEDGHIICIRAGGQMVIGSIDGEVPIKPLLEDVFRNVKYKLAYHKNIDAWLKSHIVPVITQNSLIYLHDGDLKKVANDKKMLKQAVSVMDEGFQIMEKLGYSITPAGQADLVRKHKQVAYYGLKIIHKLPFMKLVDGSFGEIAALFESFEALKQQANIETPNWDQFKHRAISKFNETDGY